MLKLDDFLSSGLPFNEFAQAEVAIEDQIFHWFLNRSKPVKLRADYFQPRPSGKRDGMTLFLTFVHRNGTWVYLGEFPKGCLETPFAYQGAQAA